MSVFRCARCGAEFGSHAELLGHVRRQHSETARRLTPLDFERDAGSESPTEAAINDAYADLQDDTFEGTAQADEIDDDVEPNSGTVIDSRARRQLREREQQWEKTVRNRERTLGDLLDPRDEYRCEVCGEVFPHREDLDRHRWIEHGPRRAAS